MRSNAELKVFLKSVLQLYDSALVTLKDKEKAKRSVINGYDDLREWLYGSDANFKSKSNTRK